MFAVVILCLLWGGVAWVIAQDRRQTVAEAVRDIHNLARAFDENITSIVSGLDHVVQLVHLQFVAQAGQLDLPKLVERLDVASSVLQIGILDNRGRLSHSSLPYRPLDLSDREYYRYHRDNDTDGLDISKPVFGRLSTKMVLQLSRRINDKDGNFAGVVMLSLDPQYFAAFHDYLDIADGGLVTVIGTDGIVRARQDADELTLGQDVRNGLLFKHLRVSRNGAYVAEGAMEGSRRYVSYRTLRDYPLVVTVARSETEVLSAFVDRRRYLLMAGLGGTLLVIGSAFWLMLLSRRQAMHAMEVQNSQARLRAFMDSVPDLGWMKNRQGKLVAVNRAFANRFGVAPQDIIGKSGSDLYDESLASKYREEDQHVLRTGQTLRHERYREDAGQKRWMEAVKAPVYDANGAIWGTCGVSRDITKRKQAETAVQQINRMLEEKSIELADANRELEAYTYTVSHDLQGPIRHISGFTRLVRDRIGDLPDPHVQRLLDKIAMATARMGGMIDDLLAFSRSTRRELHREPVDLEELVREIIEDMGLSLSDRDIEWRIESLPTALGDRNLLRLAFSNLIGNAVKYTQKRSAAIIEIRSSADHRGERVVLIRDNGVGFDMKDAERLFGVFERLHDDREFTGTGIGLATVQRIIERHGGRVWAQGHPGKGATFYVELTEKQWVAPRSDPPSSDDAVRASL